MYGIGEDITKDLILSYLTEKEIMEYYLGIPVVFHKSIRSPLRTDKKPTASFHVDNAGRLMFKDFNGSRFYGDCFEVTQKRTGLNYYSALTRIYEELIQGKDITIIPEDKRVKYEFKRKILQVKRRILTDEDLSFWGQYGISKETLDLYKVTGLQILWSDGKIIYTSSRNDVGFLFDFGDNTYKCYYPYRSDYRFITNASRYVIQGYSQLPKKGSKLIVTKALKDVMTLHELGYIAVAPQAESVLISANQMIELKARFKRVVSLMDFDYTGVCLMNKMKKLYDIPPYMLTNGRFYTPDYKAKDISDLVKLMGAEEVKKLIDERF